MPASTSPRINTCGGLDLWVGQSYISTNHHLKLNTMITNKIKTTN